MDNYEIKPLLETIFNQVNGLEIKANQAGLIVLIQQNLKKLFDLDLTIHKEEEKEHE